MDESAVALVRLDGSSVELTVTLGSSTRVFCERGTPPTLVFDLGHSRVMVEAAGLDAAVLLVVRQFADAAEYLRQALVAADEPRSALVDDAHSQLLVHVVGSDGFCSGCADRGRPASAPCPVARRAVSVVETHGVAVWDVPSGRARPG